MSMQISVLEVLFLLFVHWVCDFVCQSDEEAKNKSKNWEALLSHTSYYSFIFLLCAISYVCFTKNGLMLLFPFITFAAHTATDYYTSRVNSQLYKEGKMHEFFVSIGFDQLLHFAQLIITFQLLK